MGEVTLGDPVNRACHVLHPNVPPGGSAHVLPKATAHSLEDINQNWILDRDKTRRRRQMFILTHNSVGRAVEYWWVLQIATCYKTNPYYLHQSHNYPLHHHIIYWNDCKIFNLKLRGPFMLYGMFQFNNCVQLGLVKVSWCKTLEHPGVLS